jgi:uncharacterized membrane protein
MQRLLASAALAAALSLGTLTTSSTPAEARRGGLIAGLVVGAVIGGIVAHEIRRERRRTYYYSTYRRPVYLRSYHPRYYYY